MASITSLSNSSYNMSSIYGNRNVLSGLASGMDTESMIENAVSGIKLKIQNLIKKRTKVEWQQEAYRSIIDKAVNFNQKYTSYSSKTNLLSNSFFTNAVNTVANGTYKDKVTASGKSTSDIKINAVKQMAKAASYTVSGLGGTGTAFDAIEGKVGQEDGFKITGTTNVSNLSGSLAFQYGGTNGSTFTISFDELEDWDKVEVLNEDGTVKTGATNAEKLAQAINNKLGEITYNYTKNGFQESTTADKAIKVKADGMSITFEDGLGNGNKVSIAGASESIADTLGIKKGDDEITLTDDTELSKPIDTIKYLGGKKNEDGKLEGTKELSFTLDGVTKKISMDKVLEREGAKDSNSGFVKALNEELKAAFGSDKVMAGMTEDGKNLTFEAVKDGSTLTLGGSAAKALGFESGDSNYINASKSLKDLLGEDSEFFTKNRLKAVGKVNTEKMVDEAGNRVKLRTDKDGNAVKDEDGNDIYERVDKDGKYLYDFKVNGASINVTEDTTLESLMNSINSNPDAGVKVSYSKLTNEFKFTATATGANSKIEFEGLAKDMFASSQAEEIADQKFADAFGVDFGTSDSKSITFRVPGSMSMSFDIKADATVQDVLDQINNDSLFAHAGGSISINELTGELTVSNANGTNRDFVFKDTASDAELKTPTNPYASYTAGQDAIMDVEINGKRFENLTRSSNSFDLDGLTVNVKGEFNKDGTVEADGTVKDAEGNVVDPITFTTTTDSDKIVDTIRDFVNDYNEMITELKNAYSTMPAQNNNGARYEPLTAEQEEGMTESEIKAYNEKAKQGILFADSTLSSMYSKLLNAIAPGGTDGQTLREIGIGTSYENGLTTLSLDEDKLRTALDSDPDKVRSAFTKTQEGGSATNGLMQTMQNTLNSYVKTTGEPKGVLITRAGSVKAPTSLNSNSLKSQIDSIDNQIDRWQNKMSDQIDRYTTQFTRLEQLIAEMNSQASAMSGLMGGQGGY